MGFTHKVYLCAVSVFALLLAGALVLIGARQTHMVTQSETQRAIREQYAIAAALDLAPDSGALKQQLATLRSAYSDMGVELMLLDYATENRQSALFTENGLDIIQVSSPLSEPYAGRTLIYARDITSAMAQHRAGLRQLALIGAAALLICAALVALILGRMTAPLRQLARAMRRFARERRSSLRRRAGRDELAALNNSFLDMAGEIRAYESELSRENQRRQRFIDDLSHELRTPAAAISGYAELLYQAKLNDAQREKALEYISAESRRMLTMTEKLMLLVGLRHGPIDVSRFSAAEFADYAVAMAKPICDKYGCKLRCYVKCADITGDRELLTQLLLNLIQNSARALTDDMTISLEIYRAKSGVMLSVADHGRGMDQQTVQRATDPFYRADKSRSRSQGGAGLGLAICDSIARAHGARLSIKSKPGVGTRVSVLLSDDAICMQTRGDSDGSGVVSFHQSGAEHRNDKEGYTMKHTRLMTAIAAALTCAMCAALVYGIPLTGAARGDRVVTVQAPAAEEPIPLAIHEERDMRFARVDSSRPFTERELQMCSMLYNYSDDFDWSGVELPAEGADTGDIYYTFEGDGVALHIPDAELDWRQAAEYMLLWAEKIEPAMEPANYRDAEGRRVKLTPNEKRRKLALSAEYMQGVRPQTAAPTQPDADGYYYDVAEGRFYYPNTYELTREQLLQLLSQEHSRDADALTALELIVKPMNGDISLDEYAEGIITDYGFSLGGAQLIWSYESYPDMDGTVMIHMTGWPDGAITHDYNDAWSITMTLTGRIMSIRAPLNNNGAGDVGRELSLLYSTRQDIDAKLADSVWTDIASQYLAQHAPEFDPAGYSFEVSTVDHTRLGDGMLANVYISVCASSALQEIEHEVYHVRINPETKEVVEFITANYDQQ